MGRESRSADERLIALEQAFSELHSSFGELRDLVSPFQRITPPTTESGQSQTINPSLDLVLHEQTLSLLRSFYWRLFMASHFPLEELGVPLPFVRGATPVGDPKDQCWLFTIKDKRIKGHHEPEIAGDGVTRECVGLQSGVAEDGEAPMSFAVGSRREASARIVLNLYNSKLRVVTSLSSQKISPSSVGKSVETSWNQALGQRSLSDGEENMGKMRYNR